jgi:hypothetical protein
MYPPRITTLIEARFSTNDQSSRITLHDAQEGNKMIHAYVSEFSDSTLAPGI